MQKGKVLITSDVHNSFIINMENEGFEIDYRTNMTNEELENVIFKYKGLIISSKIVVNDVLLSKANKLEFIGRLGSGMENVDIELVKSKGIHCFNSPEGNRNAVAEHIIGMLLSLLSNIPRAHQQMRDGHWLREDNRGYELQGKTVGIIGFGNTGQAFAKKLAGFDVEILTFDIDSTKKNEEVDYQSVKLNDLFDKAHILSLHVPLNECTYHMVNDAFIDEMKNPFILINSSRGKVVSTTSMIKGLKSKKMKGAVLDVFENEKFETMSEIEQNHMRFLLNQENVICTPHIAGWTFEARKKMADHLFKKIRETWD